MRALSATLKFKIEDEVGIHLKIPVTKIRLPVWGSGTEGAKDLEIKMIGRLRILDYGHSATGGKIRGECYLHLGQLEQAAKDLKAAIEIDSEAKNPAANRARVLITATKEALKFSSEQ
jgi:hypothetical protein